MQQKSKKMCFCTKISIQFAEIRINYLTFAVEKSVQMHKNIE